MIRKPPRPITQEDFRFCDDPTAEYFRQKVLHAWGILPRPATRPAFKPKKQKKRHKRRWGNYQRSMPSAAARISTARYTNTRRYVPSHSQPIKMRLRPESGLRLAETENAGVDTGG